MHKPYALAPCGHTTCYDCLVRWFTALQNPQQHANAADPNQDSVEHILNSAPARNGAFLRRRKNCPVCRAVVVDRPIEMWGIKSMVAALVRSKLVDLPVPAIEGDPPPPVAAAEGNAANINRDNDNNDPWRNVFRRVGARNHFGFAFDGGPGNPYGPPQGLGGAGANNNNNGVEADRQQLGWFDMEDGGIYRCTDCYHEIWDGVCTACNRRYPGHRLDDDDGDDIEFDDDEDDDDDEDHDDDGYDGHFRGGFGRFLEAIMDNDAGGDLELMEEQIEMVEEEIRLREEVLQQMRHVEQHGAPAEGWLEDGHPDAVALYSGLVAENDEEEEEEGEEEDSQYGGSFIDDEAEEEHGDGFFHDDDEQGIESDAQIEFIAPVRSNNTRRPARRAHVVVESTDDEEESEAEDHRMAARQLGRGTRLGRQPTVISPPTRGRRVVQLSEDEEELSSLSVSDDDGLHTYGAVDNDSGLDYIRGAEDADEPETYGTDEERDQRAVVDDMDEPMSGYISEEGEEEEEEPRRTGYRVWVDSD